MQAPLAGVEATLQLRGTRCPPNDASSSGMGREVEVLKRSASRALLCRPRKIVPEVVNNQWLIFNISENFSKMLACIAPSKRAGYSLAGDASNTGSVQTAGGQRWTAQPSNGHAALAPPRCPLTKAASRLSACRRTPRRFAYAVGWGRAGRCRGVRGQRCAACARIVDAALAQLMNACCT